MRKFISIFVILVLCVISFTACNSDGDISSKTSSVSSSQTESNVPDSSEESSSKTEHSAYDSSEELSSKTEHSVYDSSEESSSKTEHSAYDSSEDLSSNTNDDVVSNPDASSETIEAEPDSDTSLEYNDIDAEEIIQKYEKPSGNTANIMNPQTGGSDVQSQKLRDSIIDSKSSLNIKGTTYYVANEGNPSNDGTSPEKPWSYNGFVLNSYKLEPGDAVLFKRDSVFRITSTIAAKNGVTYGAYGEGEKPCLYGSATNYANEEYWEPSRKKYVWKLEYALTDAGIIAFNHGEAVGTKQSGLFTVNKNGDFYHNELSGVLYLYYDKGNPGDIFNSIEIGSKMDILCVPSGANNVTIDNLCFKYTGAHGISTVGNNSNIVITNCEIGWIGGSIQEGSTRYGNGIQFWTNMENCIVKNNWVYQCFDAGITFQSSEKSDYRDLEFLNNLIEFCSYNFEFFAGTEFGEYGVMENIYIQDNIMRFAGYGWGTQRPDSHSVAHINGWKHCYDNVKNFNIKGNIFDCTNNYMIFWQDSTKPQEGVVVQSNTFYQKKTDTSRAIHFSNKSEKKAENQQQLELAVADFDSSPKLVKWMS